MSEEAHLDGNWMGECPDIAEDDFTWQMFVQSPWARIEQHDASDVCTASFEGVISAYDPPFSFGLDVIGMRLIVLDGDHVLMKWNEGSVPGGRGTQLLFSRPGLPELAAQHVYQRYHSEFHGLTPTFFITRWATT